MTTSKKIMVTGGLGFIGSNFIEMALERGYRVVNIDKMTYAARKDTNFDQHPNYEFIRADIAELKALPGGISTIVNFAAESHVDNSIASNEVFFKSNVKGVHTLLELLRRKDAVDRPLLVHISTDEVYGDRDTDFFTEEDKLKPSSPYSATKAAADQLVFAWSRTYGVRSRLCRGSNNYGYGQQAEKLIPKTIKLTTKGSKVPVHGNGKYIREWIYVKDYCEAVFKVMEEGKDDEIYNISSGESHTNLEVIKMILKHMGKPQDFYEFVGNRSGQDVRYAIAADKIRSLGWTPKMTLDAYIPEYLKLCETGTAKIKQGMKAKIASKIKGLIGK
ncbi:MAG: GDP-mannose 4,6-dehydratase [Patescibacteria group bacterium]